MRKGQQVVAIKDIGGFARELVPAGSKGVVTETGVFSQTKVQFTVTSMWSDKTVEIRVDSGEVA